jgi:c-di-AMP phosphodiesterase-like protein
MVKNDLLEDDRLVLAAIRDTNTGRVRDLTLSMAAWAGRDDSVQKLEQLGLVQRRLEVARFGGGDGVVAYDITPKGSQLLENVRRRRLCRRP